MAEAITYYAIVNEVSSREEPFGVIRRVKDSGGQRDDLALSRDLIWKPSSLLYSAERGDLTNDMIPISDEEAERIVSRIRAASGGVASGGPSRSAVRSAMRPSATDSS